MPYLISELVNEASKCLLVSLYVIMECEIPTNIRLPEMKIDNIDSLLEILFRGQRACLRNIRGALRLYQNEYLIMISDICTILGAGWALRGPHLGAGVCIQYNETEVCVGQPIAGESLTVVSPTSIHQMICEKRVGQLIVGESLTVVNPTGMHQ